MISRKIGRAWEGTGPKDGRSSACSAEGFPAALGGGSGEAFVRHLLVELQEQVLIGPSCLLRQRVDGCCFHAGTLDG